MMVSIRIHLELLLCSHIVLTFLVPSTILLLNYFTWLFPFAGLVYEGVQVEGATFFDQMLVMVGILIGMVFVMWCQDFVEGYDVGFGKCFCFIRIRTRAHQVRLCGCLPIPIWLSISLFPFSIY